MRHITYSEDTHAPTTPVGPERGSPAWNPEHDNHICAVDDRQQLRWVAIAALTYITRVVNTLSASWPPSLPTIRSSESVTPLTDAFVWGTR